MKKFSLPLWIFKAMDYAGFCDTDRGMLLRLLGDYVLAGIAPDREFEKKELPGVEAAFWFVVAAMRNIEEAEQ